MPDAEARVVILLHDGRALVAAEEMPLGMAMLVRNDLRYWLHGSRSLEVLDEHDQPQILRAESVSSIELENPSE